MDDFNFGALFWSGNRRCVLSQDTTSNIKQLDLSICFFTKASTRLMSFSS
jgi:hypothetical protein